MKPFAIYFPQFYPTKTNNDAWGSGFTDWVLVANANLRDAWPRRAPAAGFYDGSSPLVHSRQISEALGSGVGGFAIYHYWFYTHQELNAFETTLLQKPVPSQSLPWFLIWATESWSKRWLAKSDTLISFTSAPNKNDIERHCDYLAKCFSHSDYFRWREKPLFIFYNLAHFDSPELVVVQYREALLRRGFNISIAHFVKNPFDLDYCAFTDASYLFEPRLFFGFQSFNRGTKSKKALDILRRIFGHSSSESLLVALDLIQKKGTTFSAEKYTSYMTSSNRHELLSRINKPLQEVISPGWNNTPRYGDRFTALQPLKPPEFGNLLLEALQTSDLPPLINAWNEWSEGAAIEPCTYLGTSYMDEVSRAVTLSSSTTKLNGQK
jgi:hypothetical protein